MILFFFLLSLNCLTECSEENNVHYFFPLEIFKNIGELAEDNNTSLLQIANCNKVLRRFLFPEIIKKKIQNTCDLFLVQYDQYPDIDFSNINTQFESWFKQTQQYQKLKNISTDVDNICGIEIKKIISNKLTVENFIKVARPRIFRINTKFLQTHFTNKVPDNSEDFIIKIDNDQKYMFESFNLQKLLKDDNLNSIVRIVVHKETTFDQLIQKFNKDSFKNLVPQTKKKLKQLLCSSHHALLLSRNTEKLKLLLQSGVNPNIKTNYGDTALYWAVINKNKDIVKLLLQYQANPNIKDDYGKTALYRAIQYKNKDIVKLLLQYGADPNIKDNDGYAALHWAVEFENKDIVQLLLQYQADLSIKNDYEETALDVARALNKNDIKRLLLQYSANSNIQNNNEIKRSKLMKTLFIIIILMGTVALFQFFGKITLKTVFLELKKFWLKNPKNVVVLAIKCFYFFSYYH